MATPLSSVRFATSVKCGSKQDLYFTSDRHRLELHTDVVLLDDHQGNQTLVPFSNVAWMTPEAARTSAKVTRNANKAETIVK